MTVIKNGADFRKTMKIIETQTKQKIRLINQKLFIDAFGTLVSVTAVDKGYLRNNWDTAVDQAPPEEPLINQDPEKTYGLPQRPDAKRVKYNSVMVIYNNTEYARYIDQGTEQMPAQPMIAPAEQAIYRQAEKLCDVLSKEKIK